jgi:uncharacterized protein
MKTPQYRAWRFALPDFDNKADSYGIGISNIGGIDMVDEHAAVRQSILLLLSTAPGERVMRPNYGCELSQLVFAPNDETTHGLAIHYVRQALQRWEPRIDILRLDASANQEDPGRTDILLEYRVRKTTGRDNLEISISLTEEVR